MILRKRYWIWGSFGVAIFTAIACLLWAFFAEPRRLCMTFENVPVAQWAGTDKRVRLAVVGDFHFAPGDDDWAKRIVETILSGNPDVVLLLGDYVNGHSLKTSMPPTEIAAHLKPLAERVPVFAVLGNHDAFVGRQLISAALQSVGIEVFEEKAVRELNLPDGVRIILGGTVDAHSFYPVFDATDVPRNPLAGNAPFILLTHSPDAVLFLNETVDLTVCGHTHGGQICLPGGVPVVTSSRLVGRDFAAGMHSAPATGTPVFITRGVGTSILPMRFFCLPEVAFIDLIPGEKDF